MKMTAFMIAVLAAIIFWGGSGNASAQSGSMDWRGTVDDTVQIIVRGRDATTNTLSGSQTYDARAYFNGRLRDSRNVSVEKKNGRGKVYIVQQPNRRNNYTTIIEIVDKKGGSDRYAFTLYWD